MESTETGLTGPLERIAFWREDGPRGVEFLKGRYDKLQFAPHAHDRDLFGLVTQGALAVVDPMRRAIAHAGQMILYNHDQIHWGHAACRDGWSIMSVYLAPETLNQAAREMGTKVRGTIAFPNIVTQDRILTERFATLFTKIDLARDSLARSSLLLEILADLLTRHADCCVPLPSAGSEPAAVKTAREFLDRNFSSNVSIRELSTLCGISQYWLIRAFKTAHGVPPYAYLTNIRVRQALHLLRQGMPVAEVALVCGFADQSHLTRVFKRAMAVTPGRFQGDLRKRRGYGIRGL